MSTPTTQILAPAVNMSPVAAITPNGATLQGTVNAQGSPTTYHFEYGPTQIMGSSVPVPDASAGSAAGPQPVTQQISGLTPGTVYYFALVARNAGGVTSSNQFNFFTTAAPPVISPSPATAVSINAATLQGTVTTGGAPTSYHFEYGTTTSYGSSIQASSAGSGTTPQTVTQALSKGLTAGTRYHCRIVATNSANRTATGADVAFTYAPRGE
jgi:hypothetical protein